MYKFKIAYCASEKEKSNIMVKDTSISDDRLEKNASWVIRGAVIATGIGGAIIFARSLRLFTKFEHARQIPDEFFRKHLQLRGKVAYLTGDGRLRVYHEPIFRSPLSWLMRGKKDPIPDAGETEGGKLSLSVAGVELTEPGKSWMRQQLLWRPIWFTLVRRSNEDDIQVEVIAKTSRFGRKYSINRELIRRGLGSVPRVDDYAHDLALKTNAEYSRLINDLIISEKYADRRGVGMWRRPTALESLLSYPSQVRDRLEHTSVYRLLSLMATGLKQLGQLSYTGGRSAVRSLGSAAQEYRRLSKSE